MLLDDKQIKAIVDKHVNKKLEEEIVEALDDHMWDLVHTYLGSKEFKRMLKEATLAAVEQALPTLIDKFKKDLARDAYVSF